MENKAFYSSQCGKGDCSFYHGGYGVSLHTGIREGLKEYLDQAVLGYTGATEEYYQSVQDWMEKHHGFRPPRKWFLECSGVISALDEMLAAYTEPGDGVLIMTPVYNPFRTSAERAGCFVTESRLLEGEKGWQIDWEDFESRAKEERVAVCILCSPHNPLGRIWTEEELRRIAGTCLENQVFLSRG